MWIILLLLCALVFCLYWALASNYNYWKKRRVPSPPASLFFGNLGPTLSLKKSAGQICTDIYNDYPNLLYVGYYKFRQPAILLRDPELIRNVLVKEFSSFHDNDIIVDEKADPIAARNPFGLKGNRWKVIRSQISPCFTSKKLKAMYPLVEDAVRKLVKYLETEPDATSPAGLETKEVCSKYSTEVVASCVFGLEGNSFADSNSEFRRFGRKIFEPTAATIAKFLVLSLIPSMAKFFKVKFFSADVVNYFQNITKQTLKYREQKGVVRNDFLDFMKDLQAKLGKDEFTDVDVLAHAMGFFTDGFETSSAVISHAFFHIGYNSDIQKKLYQEVQAILEKNGGRLDYDTLHALPYLDAVVNETLRMHPPGMVLMRACTKPFTLLPPRGAGTGPEVPVEVGIPVTIPAYALHYDPRYFPDPERFDPDRFSEANKDHIPRGTYLPFGDGPRACHGQRFGIMQTKAAIANVVAHFEIKVSSKTKVPLEIDPVHLVPQPKGGIWLNFNKRQN